MFRFKLAEFFSGPGGMGYGAGLSKVKGSSIEHAWASDYDQDSCNTYKRNIKTKCARFKIFIKLLPSFELLIPPTFSATNHFGWYLLINSTP